MARPLRWLRPDTVWFVTNRIHQRRLLLRGDDECNALVGLWLARALRRFPGVTLFGFVSMGNHLHVLAKDTGGDLSAFMHYLATNLAKAVNQLRDREGHVFDRRFSAEPVLDKEAELGRLLYLVTNPVSAGLVPESSAWPGVLLLAREGKEQAHTFRWWSRQRYENALRNAARLGALGHEVLGVTVSPDDFWEEETVVVHPLEDLHEIGIEPERVIDRVRNRERAIHAERRGKPFLGAATVLRQDPRTRPKRSSRSPRPLCHASADLVRKTFRSLYRSFRRAFWSAAEALRAGELDVRFPSWSFPPWRPLVRVVEDTT
ncbi:MAG: hypothetical protein U0610_03120 [bacterium]